MFKFISYSSLKRYFEEKFDITDADFFIGSVGDLLFIIEQFKKNGLDITFDTLKAKHSLIKDFSSNGNIHFVELDSEILSSNLFEEREDGVLCLDAKAANTNISPQFSIGLLCLKINSCNCFWELEVFNEMESHFLSFESYG
jgi:hypothetical protein